jgi:DNA-binding PadR family transcriptional regulator
MLVRLFILGIVYEHDTHGYEIKATAKLWGIERWAKIGLGSIYHAISKMTSEGLIEQLEAERVGTAPMRYMFRITDEGRRVFLEMLRETLRSPSYERRDIDLALAFAANLPPTERQALVQERLKGLEQERQRLQSTIDYAARELGHAAWIGISLKHAKTRLDAEIDWTRELVTQIEHLQVRKWN